MQLLKNSSFQDVVLIWFVGCLMFVGLGWAAVHIATTHVTLEAGLRILTAEGLIVIAVWLLRRLDAVISRMEGKTK